METLRNALEQMAGDGVPGAFVHIDHPDGSADFLTAGVADIATGAPMSPDSRYRVGSSTKTFTAVVVLQLVAEGRLTLDAPVGEWVPEFDLPHAGTLTVEDLLRMRSGLFDFEDHPALLGDLDAHLVPRTLQEVLEMGLNGAPTFRPGERFEYCNTNFCLLERVVERITGRTLGVELRERVFQPLRMHSTTYPAEDDLSLPGPFIRGYDRTADGWRDCSEEFFGRGDGAIVSTALDVARFFRGLLRGDLLGSSLLEQMMTVVHDDPPARFTYGLGLIADELPSGLVWGHSGGGFGYRHWPFLDLETQTFAVFMVNGTYGFRTSAAPPTAEFSPAVRALVYG